MENFNIEEEIKRLQSSMNKLNSNSEELNLILNAILKKSNDLNHLDKHNLKKHLKKHIEIEDKIDKLGK